jgi:predicted transcriptional regulator
VASFVTGHAASPADEVARDLETLAQQFERSKPYLIERWYRAS